MFIDLLFGEQENLIINIDDYNKEFIGAPYKIWDFTGYVSCTNFYRYIMTEHHVYCEIVPELKNISGTINFVTENRTLHKIEYNNLISFKGQPDIDLIYFEIKGYDSKNNLKSIRTKLKKISKYDDNDFLKKSYFVIYTLTLFGIVLFSVPLMVLNLNNIYKRDMMSTKPKKRMLNLFNKFKELLNKIRQLKPNKPDSSHPNTSN